jgi:hypothetical protein
MELFCDPDIFEDEEKVEKKKKIHVRKNDIESYVPNERNKLWFLNRVEQENPDVVDCFNHPDKYVQQDIFQELDRKALRLKSSGDYYFVMKNDVNKALEHYLESFETCTKQNTVMRRELSEAIPICFSKLERYDESLARFKGLLKKHFFMRILLEHFKTCSNDEMKTSLFNAVLDNLPKQMALEFGIDVVGIHMDEPQLWAKALKFLEFGTEQHLVCLLAILRQTNYTLRHSENEVHEFYKWYC